MRSGRPPGRPLSMGAFDDHLSISVAGVPRSLRCWRPMGALDGFAARVAEGQTVDFRPSGIRSRQLVTVAPVDPTRVAVGDIVLVRAAGTTYLHLVSAVDAGGSRVQISNNRGRVNGWTNHARVYGIRTAVDGVPRPRIDGKTRRQLPALDPQQPQRRTAR